MLVDATQFIFDSKVGVLERLKDTIPNVIVKEIRRITYKSWSTSPEAVINDLEEQMNYPFIVRSTSSEEDTTESSAAGVFESVLNIQSAEELSNAIDLVFASYIGECSDFEEVFVQPMVLDIVLCGVAMTHKSKTNWQYHVLEFSTTGKTDDVTNGSTLPQTVTYVSERGSSYLIDPLKPVDAMLEVLKVITGRNDLDVEFAIDKTGALYLFQVRPIAYAADENRSCNLKTLRFVENRIKQANEIVHSNTGAPAFFSIMTDWNPAEMIGTKPRPLALSLYRMFITDSSWAVARHRHSYKDCRGTPLMHIFGGTPYIDVATSFRSFIPNNLKKGLTAKIINAALNWLRCNPHLHDKVEFQVIPTCYVPSLMKERPEAFSTLSEKEWDRYISSLHRLTRDMLEPEGYCAQTRIRLERNRKASKHEARIPQAATLNKRIWSIRKQEATIFAEVARIAFVFTAIVKDIEAMGAVESGFVDRILSSNDLIVTEISDDLYQSRETFLKKHGHIRPGTYEITVPSYEQNFGQYFPNPEVPKPEISMHAENPLKTSDITVLKDILDEHQLGISTNRFIELARWAVAERERAKYEYACCISNLLLDIQKLYESKGVSAEYLSYLSIDQILNHSLCLDLEKGAIKALAKRHRKEWEKSTSLRMPEVISSARDIFCFNAMTCVGNFIGNTPIEAEVCTAEDSDIEGRIILIENADPGYDWLFLRNISGLITRYGGENSHMAVRARELCLPAVIGIGSAFAEYCKVSRLRIDPINKTIARTR